MSTATAVQESRKSNIGAKYSQKGMRLHPYPHNPMFTEQYFRELEQTPLNTQYYQAVFDHILKELYPTICTCGELCKRHIKNREYSLRCPKCLRQKSKLAHTPFRNLRIPQYMAGWLIEESYIRHPKVITAAEIERKLGISYRSALLLKRRMQIMACEIMPVMKELIYKELKKEFPDSYKLPPSGENVSEWSASEKTTEKNSFPC